jgi:hypothetical protein
MFHQIKLPNSKLPSIKDQFQLPLKPINTVSKLTPVELSQPDAEPASIMESLLSDMELKTESTTSLLKTHGEHHGEIKDTLKLDKTTSAVFS